MSEGVKAARPAAVLAIEESVREAERDRDNIYNNSLLHNSDTMIVSGTVVAGALVMNYINHCRRPTVRLIPAADLSPRGAISGLGHSPLHWGSTSRDTPPEFDF